MISAQLRTTAVHVSNKTLNLLSISSISRTCLVKMKSRIFLKKVDDLVLWSNDIKDYALKLVLIWKKWVNHKLVEGHSTRKYSNYNDVAAAVIKGDVTLMIKNSL